ncbi:MAG: NAD(P)/FAD-dependent oxidoreductase [Myxococcota bacterium]
MKTPDSLDAVVIGGGVVGLSVARALARRGREVVVLEAEAALGTHSSSRNSEVIHAGIYYANGSLKAALCVEGKRQLYAYCEREGITHTRLGKLIVATRDEEIPELERILARAGGNGVDDLVWFNAADVRALEPELIAVRALWSPSTGIVDSHALMAALKRDAVSHGAHVVTSTSLLGGCVEEGGFSIEIGGADRATIHCRALVNAAGLSAPSVSRSLRGVPTHTIPKEYFAKGHYFVLNARSPFRHLVYPVPVPGGLGVHVTLDLSGRVRFGPDVSWISGIDYAFEEQRAASFYAAIRAYYPALADQSLSPGYTGIRPKLGPEGSTHDFMIQGPDETGVPGFVALYGIESPGLTASLAIADRVCAALIHG